MNMEASKRGLRRLQRLSRLQELAIAAAEDVHRTALQEQKGVDERIEGAERQLGYAQKAMQSGPNLVIAEWQLMSALCDAQLGRLAALAADKKTADQQVDHTQASLAEEKRRSDVLTEAAQRRSAALMQQRSWQLERETNDLWLAGRRWG